MMCHCGGHCGQCSGGLGRLMGALLPAGSQVKVGFSLGVQNVIVMNQDEATTLQNEIEGCVYATGGFSSVNVAIDWSYFSAAVYATIAVQTANDHAAIEDVGDWIQGAIQACVPGVDIIRRDPTVGVGATDSAGNPLPQGNAPPPGQKCDYNTMKLGDYLACQFGVSTGTAVTLGVVLTLGILLALGRR